ncbi:serine-tRNA(Ala) deacylase AlaX [Candidatus Halobonum tyrrellensis]|uniref:Alanyl-tRNA synthetase n=1 Tax=Candidatus Halobonum tyrrellensis G22 TaxID=1324957 RepID=V4J0T1_9EURY|nr:serine-tRNA(Ala) deacylase AlaX [Candidatus Halobonum tyrrellensis]ESP89077.1 alanyl-tRNA synthetase [Candidatus Halobonum tyrrellensis G22]
MSETLAPAAPEVREFETTVRAADGRTVELEETYFYAEAGGQPADRGTLAGVAVTDVQSTADGRVVHTLAEAPDVAPGETVTGVVDDAFRTYCTRAHTASHALYGAGRELLDDLGYGGFGITADPVGGDDAGAGEAGDASRANDADRGEAGRVDGKVRVDFVTSTDVDDDVLVELERLVNRAVWDSRAVTWEEVPVEEARASDRVAFNTKTEEGVMADADAVRVVTIDGFDWAACGGTHVSNTREIGPVTLLDRSNPGEGLTRVEFAVGPTAVDRRARDHRAARAAARELDSGLDGLADAAARLRAERSEAETELAALRAEVLDARLAGLEATSRCGRTWLVGSVDGFDANAVGERAQERVTPETPVVAVVGEGDAPFVVVASDGDVDAGAVVDDLTDEFGGGGGGRPTFAQGGGLSADPADVLAWLRG